MSQKKNKIIIASANQGKIKEFYKILGDQEFELLSMKDIGFEEDIVESGNTFEANALIKAETISTFSGLPVLSDDSGLSVTSLNGEPGVYSARYAGENATDEQNNQKLLKNLNGIFDRNAMFVAVLCFIKDGEPQFFRGETPGKVLESGIGDKGFGYDPLFIPDGSDLTYGQMELNQKKAYSHRGKAVALFKEYLDKHKPFDH